MSGFSLAQEVEVSAMEVIRPFAKARAHNGMIICPNDGAVGIALQKSYGDIFIQSNDRRVTSIELKAEKKFTGRLFLETWSNRNLEDLYSHAERGSEPGWLVKSRADVLFYYFLDTDYLFVSSMFLLQQWAFGSGKRDGRLYAFPEYRQGKYDQKNDTFGRCVDIDVLNRELARPPRVYHPRAEIDGATNPPELQGAELDVTRGQQYV